MRRATVCAATPGAALAAAALAANPQGRLIYGGAIDDRPSTDPADVRGATNYVSAALTEAMAGKPVTTPSTRPYGCSVKYADRGR